MDSPLEQASAGRCELCGAASRPWIQKRGEHLEWCESCSTGFLPRHRIPDDLEAIYGPEYFEGGRDTGYPGYLADEALMASNFSDRLAWIGDLRAPGRLLDVGAAYGVFLAEAVRMGWDAAGVEIAPECAAEAERRTGCRVHAGDFLEASLEGPFDAITFFDVIEHMRDPRAALERAISLLGPEGWLIVETGDPLSPWARLLGRHWYFLDPPQHLFYLGESSLRSLFAAAGASGPIRTRRMGRRVSLQNAAFKAASGLPALARPLGWLARLPLRAYLNFGDSLMIAVRKT